MIAVGFAKRTRIDPFRVNALAPAEALESRARFVDHAKGFLES
jgi:hypothetical protein